MGLFATSSLSSLCLSAAWKSWFARSPAVFLVLAEDLSRRPDVYNVLWVLVFGFATLNILGLVARKFEPERSRLSFGESLAIMVVLVSVALLGWEMLYYFKVLPIKLKP
jgi:NhaP-type Na+/H+ and K+/H+ antiporter